LLLPDLDVYKSALLRRTGYLNRRSCVRLITRRSLVQIQPPLQWKPVFWRVFCL